MNPGMGYPEGGDQGQYGNQPPMDVGAPGLGMGEGMGGGDRIFPAVKLRGLPFDVTEDDIRMFLGCDPVDILMVHRGGRLSGECFILLPSPMQIEMALSKNRTYLGRRYIEVYRSKKVDYYKAIMSEMMDGMPPQGGGGGYHGGGGGYGMAPPQMGMYDQGGYGGGGGMQGPPHGGYGGGGGGGDGGMNAGTTILKLRGLPFSVQDDDIVRWFEDPSLGITPLTSDSVFIAQEHGRPTGIAFVELPTPQECMAAMAKNKQMMGSRYIEIFPANRADLEKYRVKGAGGY